MGVLVVPIIFNTLRSSGCTQTTSLLGAVMIIFENGLVTQSRLILLDSPLVFCTAFTAWAWTIFDSKYHSTAIPGDPVRTATGAVSPDQGDGVFSPEWWIWLILTGLGLGATVSMKWVGLFTIAWVGSLTVLQLWNLLGDLRVTPVSPPPLSPRIAKLMVENMDEPFPCPSIVSNHHSDWILYVNVWNSFSLSC